MSLIKLWVVITTLLFVCGNALALPSHESEVAFSQRYTNAAIASKELTPEDANYLYFFTSYTLPERLRQDGENSLSFVLNKSANVFNYSGKIYRPKKISPTMYVIDIRDFGWTIPDWDFIASLQAYFQQNITNYGVTSYVDKVFRIDWFVVNATDTTKQDDIGIKEYVYYVLLYGRGKEPKTGTEFRKIWGVDIDAVRKHQLERGIIVDEGHSGVSRHTRQLRRSRTIFGYYWETRDVKAYDALIKNLGAKKNQFQEQDYIEDIFAKHFDAMELIVSHKNGLQVYLLNNQDDKRIEFADNAIVIDKSDIKDVRVRGGKCDTCHAMGINPATNEIAEIFNAGGDIHAYDDKLQKAIAAFYLDEDFGDIIEEDNRIYERAIKKCNDLTPIDNAKAYTNIYNWYLELLDTKQAALEIGLTVEEYKEKIKFGTTGRLVQLFYDRKVPRLVWDSLNAGIYTQSILLHKRIQIVVPGQKLQVLRVISNDAPIQTFVGNTNVTGPILTRLKKGSLLQLDKKEGKWYPVGVGWIHEQFVEVVEIGGQ
jgi:hypothetical protein